MAVFFCIKIAFQFVPLKNKIKIMSRENKKGVYTGIIEQDEKGNFFCGEYLLDYKYTISNFKIGNEVNIKSIIENPSDINYDKYPKKSKDFFLSNLKE